MLSGWFVSPDGSKRPLRHRFMERRFTGVIGTETRRCPLLRSSRGSRRYCYVSNLIPLGVQPIVLHPKARDAIRRFPKEVRIRLGRGPFRMQLGEQIGMPNSRPMPAVASGVSELRVKSEDGIFRVFYYTASPRGVLVFHAFVKKTQRTPPLERELARKRLKELLDA